MSCEREDEGVRVSVRPLGDQEGIKVGLEGVTDSAAKVASGSITLENVNVTKGRSTGIKVWPESGVDDRSATSTASVVNV